MRISRGALSCETNKEADRIYQKVRRKQGILAQKPRYPTGSARERESPQVGCFCDLVFLLESDLPTCRSLPRRGFIRGIPRFLCQNRSFPVYFSERQGAPMPRIPQSSHNNSWGWVSLLVAWNVPIRSILLACDFVKASQCIAIVTKEEDVICFRPPDTTSGPLICPECGKKIVSQNFRPVNCPFCKAPLPPEGAPAAPSAGGAPVAPGAPTVPGAPKPPSGK